MPDSNRPLSQVDVEHWIRDELGKQPWTEVYRYTAPRQTAVHIHSGLVPLDFIPNALSRPDWDLQVTNEGPSLSSDGTSYLRNSNFYEIEALVMARDFRKRRPDYIEISEELKLLFNLYEDRESGTYFHFEDDGEETPVIQSTSNAVEMRTPFLRRYLAARQMGLLIQIDSIVWLPNGEEKSDPSLPEERSNRGDDYCFEFWSGRDELYSFSRLLGKKILWPSERSKSELWPFPKQQEYAEFIVGEDEMGHAVKHTCDPMRVPSTFSASSRAGQPNTLTPIFFRREVLQRYFANPDRYEVTEGGIRCGPVWRLRADTAHPKHVSAFLGDLGTDLPASEQKYWQAHNISPIGRSQSNSSFRRNFLIEYAQSEMPEHRFKRSYVEANIAWEKAFRWRLHKALHTGDRHVLDGIHTPLQNTHAEFDQQLVYLTKLMVDSLNEEAIVAALPNEESARIKKDDKSIAKLERLLESCGMSRGLVDRDMTVLRTIQGLRSKGAAHRKSSDFDVRLAGLDPTDLRGGFSSLLNDCVQVLDDLTRLARSKDPQ